MIVIIATLIVLNAIEGYVIYRQALQIRELDCRPILPVMPEDYDEMTEAGFVYTRRMK